MASAASLHRNIANLTIRLLRVGCTNRPFFHLVVQPKHKDVFDLSCTVEQVGTYDPMPNFANEKLVALNFDRIKYWLGTGASASKEVQQLFGLCGFFPVHPMSYAEAKRNRAKLAAKMAQQQQENAVKEPESPPTS